jgi:hypothetical protein
MQPEEFTGSLFILLMVNIGIYSWVFVTLFRLLLMVRL